MKQKSDVRTIYPAPTNISSEQLLPSSLYVPQMRKLLSIYNHELGLQISYAGHQQSTLVARLPTNGANQ